MPAVMGKACSMCRQTKVDDSAFSDHRSSREKAVDNSRPDPLIVQEFQRTRPSGYVSPTVTFSSMAFEHSFLSNTEIRMVIESWSVLKPNCMKLGETVFYTFFRVNPKLLFLFTKFKYRRSSGHYLKSLSNKDIFHRHIEMVVGQIDLVVNCLQDVISVQESLSDTRVCHANAGVRQQDINLIFPYFIQTFKEEYISLDLKESWTPELELAWKHFFAMVSEALRGETPGLSMSSHSNSMGRRTPNSLDREMGFFDREMGVFDPNLLAPIPSAEVTEL